MSVNRNVTVPRREPARHARTVTQRLGCNRGEQRRRGVRASSVQRSQEGDDGSVGDVRVRHGRARTDGGDARRLADGNVTNCEPWTVGRLASHALNNQLLWAGVVTGQQLVSADDTMGAVPLEGDLATIADDVAARATAMWGTEGLLEGATPHRSASCPARSL